MGIFNYIEFSTICPTPGCGTILHEFQSKDEGANRWLSMSTLAFWEVDNFYAYCDKCKRRIEFTLKKERREKFTITDYQMEIKKI